MLLQIHEPGETPLPHENAEAVGIDLGTTNSLVAISRGEKPEVIGGLMPSVVMVDGETVHSIKRKMSEPAQMVRGKTPVEISAEILKRLRIRAEEALDREVTKAVITVPAYFDDTARAATKDAAKLAGLEVLRLINEPTAAALAYGLDKGAEGVYAIYDLGGGTFDISILSMQKGVFQVLATGGDLSLGGDDFDALVSGGRAAKEKLTMASAAERASFEKLAKPLVDRSLEICKRVLKDAGLRADEIKGVVLVGGSTRMPMIAELLTEFFGKAPLSDINPDEAVALGAAIQAESLTRGSDNLLLDVTPLSLGIETMHGIVEKIIYRNSPIPCSHAQEFTTFQNDQTGMMIHVVQGERETVEECRSLARFELKGIPAMVAGAVKVRVTFTVDADGMLTVGAVELGTGVQQEVAVKPSYGLAEGEIERMLLESFEHGQADMRERLLREGKLEAERLLLALEPALVRYQVDGVQGILEKVAELKIALGGNDLEKINLLREKLNHQSEAIAERIMNDEIGKALEGRRVDEV